MKMKKRKKANENINIISIMKANIMKIESQKTNNEI